MRCVSKRIAFSVAIFLKNKFALLSKEAKLEETLALASQIL